MNNKVKRLIALLFIIVLSVFVIKLFKINMLKKYDSITLSDINNKYYDISIDINNKTATIDGKKYKIDGLDNISKKDLYNYIKENSYGDINQNGNEIQINNPYSLENLIVKTKDENVFDKYEEIEKIDEITEDIYIVSYKNSKDTKNAYQELLDDKDIEKVSTDKKVKAFDYVTVKPWGISSMALDFYTERLVSNNNQNIVKVAVLDTGVRTTHEVFKTGDIIKDRLDFDGAYDFVNDDDDPTDDNDHTTTPGNNGEEVIVPEHGHGTMVSGLIAQSTPSNIKIVPVKVLDETGTGTFSNVLLGINNVKDKVDIVNLSLGSDESDDLFEEALQSIYEETNLVIVAAAGNNKGKVSYPANSPYTLSISSVNVNSEFSSSFSNFGREVDFSAPGEDLFLPTLDGDTYYMSGFSGTSFSSPFASAAIALVKAENPSFTREEIVNNLKLNVVDLGSIGKDNYYGYGSINYHTFIDDLTVSNNWAKTNTLTVLASSVSETNYYSITNEEKQPTKWNKLPNSKTININEEIKKNGKYYIWIKNNSKTKKFNNGSFKQVDNTGITHKEFNVEHVDNENPLIINNIGEVDIKSKSITVNLTTKDNLSGLSKIIWYYKSSNDNSYSAIIDEMNNEIEETLKEKELINLSPDTDYKIYAEIYDVAGNKIKTKELLIRTLLDKDIPYASYSSHIQNIGWQKQKNDGEVSGTEGKGLRLEGIKIKVENKGTYSGSIEYQSHIQNIGWQNYINENNISGTAGKALRMEAIRIKLTGDLKDNFDIYYRVHIQNYGWLDYTKNGGTAGSVGFGLRMEAIQIVILPIGSDAPGKTSSPYIAKIINYSTHIQNIGWQQYKYNGYTSGTEGKGLRVEGIKIKLDNVDYTGSVEYSSNVQGIGWQDYVKDGEISGTAGQALRLEAIKIRLTGDISNYYDIYYRVHVQNLGWLDWAKNDEIAGTIGYSYRLEAIQVKMVSKGDTAPGKTNITYKEKMINYRTHIQNIGWQQYRIDGETSGTTGKGLRLEGINIKLDNANYTGSVEYSSNVQGIGWQDYVKDGETSGTAGQALRLEAIKIRLTEDISNYYDIYYRVHVQNLGWLGWAKNDEIAGTIGYSYRLEAIQIQLVKKDTTFTGSTNRPSIIKE